MCATNGTIFNTLKWQQILYCSPAISPLLLGEHMRKELYISVGNIAEKTQIWLDEIAAHSKLRDSKNFCPEKSALLIIDMQNFFLDEKSHAFVPSAKAIVPAIKRLANEFRKLKRPI